MPGVAPEPLGRGSRWLLHVIYRGPCEGPELACRWGIYRGYVITATLSPGGETFRKQRGIGSAASPRTLTSGLNDVNKIRAWPVMAYRPAIEWLVQVAARG